MHDSFTPFLHKLHKNMMEQGAIAMQLTVDHARDNAKTTHEYQDQTGGLTAATVSGQVTQEGSRIIGEIANTSELSLWIHEGTGLYKTKGKKEKYLIQPKKKKALAWELGGGIEMGGTLIFARKVMHPGIHPDPFLVRALNNSKAFMLKQIAGAMGKAVRLSMVKK